MGQLFRCLSPGKLDSRAVFLCVFVFVISCFSVFANGNTEDPSNVSTYLLNKESFEGVALVDDKLPAAPTAEQGETKFFDSLFKTYKGSVSRFRLYIKGSYYVKAPQVYYLGPDNIQIRDYYYSNMKPFDAFFEMSYKVSGIFEAGFNPPAPVPMPDSIGKEHRIELGNENTEYTLKSDQHLKGNNWEDGDYNLNIASNKQEVKFYYDKTGPNKPKITKSTGNVKNTFIIEYTYTENEETYTGYNCYYNKYSTTVPIPFEETIDKDPENSSIKGSGFRCYFFTKNNLLTGNSSITKSGTDYILPIGDYETDIYALDNLHNESDSIKLNVKPDFTPPSVTYNYDDLKYDVGDTGDPQSKYSVSIPVSIDNNQNAFGININDSGSGTRSHAVMLWAEINGNMELLSVVGSGYDSELTIYSGSVTGKIETSHNNIVLKNLVRNIDYRLCVTAMDNVGNKYNPTSMEFNPDSETIGLPATPILNVEQSFLSWNSAGKPVLNGQFAIIPDAIDLFSSISFEGIEFVQGNSISQSAISALPKEDAGNGVWHYNFEKEIDAAWMQENIHQNIDISLGINLVGIDVTSGPFTLDSIPNRIPCESSTKDLVFVSSEKPESTVFSLDNNYSNYKDDWAVADSSDGLQQLITAKTDSNPELFTVVNFFSQDNAKLILAEDFADFDGDTISAENVYHQGTGKYYLVLKESAEDFEVLYLLPYILNQDTTPPVVNSMFLLKDDKVCNYIEENGTVYAADFPDQIILEVQDSDDMSKITVGFDGKEHDFERDDINIDAEESTFTITWPFSASQFSDGTIVSDFSCNVFDEAGNSVLVLRSLAIDRDSPEPLNNGDAVVRTSSDNFKYAIYGNNQEIITLEFIEGYFADPLSVYGFAIDLTQLELRSEIESAVLLNNGVRIILADEFPGNTALPVKVTINDVAGNSTDNSLLFYTPALLKESDVIISGNQVQTYDQWTGSHFTGFQKDPEQNILWSGVTIDRKTADQEWTSVTSLPWDGADQFNDENLEAHGLYQYRFKPVNGSGSVSVNALTMDITVGNYSPLVEIDEEQLIGKADKYYFGPLGSIPFSTDDRDGDMIYTNISVNGNLLEETDSELALTLDGSPYIVAQGKNIFTNAEEYSISLQSYDVWSDNEQGGSVQTNPLVFIYDDTPPEPGQVVLLNESRTIWGTEGLTITAQDGLSGLYLIEGEMIKNDGASETLYVDNPPGSGFSDNEVYKFSFPEGQYQFVLKLTDRTGNSTGTIDMGEVRLDRTSPVIDALAIHNENNVISNGNYIFSNSIVNLDIEWSDNLSGIAACHYQYRKDGTVVCEGSKSTMNPMLAKQQLDCTPSNGQINQKDGYSLWVCIEDQGGNVSSWKEAAASVVFDTMAPSINFKSWALEQKDGIYITAEASVPLPQFEISDNYPGELTTEYSLLDNDGNVISNPNNTFSLSEEGRYRIQIAVIDESGISSSKTIPFIFDATGPDQLFLDIDDSGNIYSGDFIDISLSAFDELSGIEKYRLEFQEAGETVAEYTYSAFEADSILFKVPETENPTCRFVFSAVDNAGNWSSQYFGNPVTVEQGEDRLVIDAPSFYGWGQVLSAFWTYYGSEEMNYYDVSVSGIKDISETVIYSDSTEHPYALIDSTELPDVIQYEYLQIKVTPYTSGGQQMESVISHRIRIDAVSPVITNFDYPEVISTTGLPLSWEIEEEGTLLPLQLIIEQLDSVDDTMIVKSIRSINLDTNSKEGQLDLFNIASFDSLFADGKAFRLRLHVQDKAGLIAESSSEILKVDTSPAPSYAVYDQGDFINPELNNLEFNWFWAEVDPESGVEGYWYQLTEDGTIDPEKWEFTDTSKVAFGLSQLSDYENAAQLYLAVRRQNAGGQEIIQYSDGIILDNSRPEITSVTIVDNTGQQIDDIYYTEERNVHLRIDGYDNESGIDTYSVQGGKRNLSGFDEKGELVESDSDLITAELPLMDKQGDVLSFQAMCYNGASQESLASYSPGIIFNPTAPVIDDIFLCNTEGKIKVIWSAASQAPIKAQNLSLTSNEGKTVVVSESVPAGAREYVFDVPDLADGIYQVFFSIEDIASNKTEKYSPQLTIDTKAPEISGLVIPDYVYRMMSVSLTTDEAITDLTLNISTASEQLLNRNYPMASPVTVWKKLIDFTKESCWEKLAGYDNRLLIVSIKLRDVNGNWSDYNEHVMVFDSSAPKKPLVSRNNALYWNNYQIIPDPAQSGLKDKISGVTVMTQDDISPVVSYRWAVTENKETPLSWSGSKQIAEPGIVLNVVDAGFDNLMLEDGSAYYLAVQARNACGEYSETGFSELIQIDLKAPGFTITPVDYLYLDETDESIPVYNGNGKAELTIEDELSSHLVLRINIYDPFGNEISSGLDYWDKGEGDVKTIEFDFDPAVAGLHQAAISLEDFHGRTSKKVLVFHSNTAPVVNAPQEINTTPGKEITINYTDWIKDSDGMSSLLVESEDLEEPVNLDWGSAFTLVLDQRNNWDQVSEYEYTLTATDNMGIQTVFDLVVTVNNSTEGELLRNEYWSGKHILTGALTVPEGLELHIADGTVVKAKTGLESGNMQALIIRSGAELIHYGEAEYTSNEGDNPVNYWKGIYTEQSILLKDITVSNAERGITVAAGVSMVIENCVFSNNVTGLHILSDQVSILESEFLHNKYYGIKTEKDCIPEVNKNIFKSNGFDYYDFELSVISVDELNQLPGSNENTGE